MTRNFSNQGRDGMRPSSRGSFSGNSREDRDFRTDRPRLSRDAVDRGWENGAPRKYSDYHPRSNTPRPPYQQQRRPTTGYQRPQQSTGNRFPDTYQETHRPSPSSSNNGYQQREHTSANDEQRFHPSGQRGFRPHSGSNNDRWQRNQQRDGTPPRRDYSSPYRDDNRSPRPGPNDARPSTRNQYQSSNGPRSSEYNRDQSTREPRSFERSFQRQDNRPRSFDQRARPESFSRERRNDQRQGNYNPRWQSRPGSQAERPRWQGRSQGENGQFEGDYEHFSTAEQREREHTEQSAPAYEPHVTRLPDGRVLKGSRPSQHKQAVFWSEVADETQTLLPPTPAETTKPSEDVSEVPGQRPPRPARPRKQPEGKPRTAKTARPQESRAQTGQEKPGKKKVRGPQKSATRPSQRGFKWQTTEEQTTTDN